MQVGDLVKYNSLGRVIIGIITHFDEDDDPAVLDLKTGDTTSFGEVGWRF